MFRPYFLIKIDDSLSEVIVWVSILPSLVCLFFRIIYDSRGQASVTCPGYVWLLSVTSESWPFDLHSDSWTWALPPRPTLTGSQAVGKSGSGRGTALTESMNRLPELNHITGKTITLSMQRQKLKQYDNEEQQNLRAYSQSQVVQFLLLAAESVCFIFFLHPRL